MNVCGLEILDLPPGYTPLEAIVLVKTLDAEGNVSWCRRGTDGLTDEECVGILTADAQRIVNALHDRWLSDEDDE